MIAVFLRAVFASTLARWLVAWWDGRGRARAATEHVENAVMKQQIKEVEHVHAAQEAARAGGDPALTNWLSRQYVD